MPTNGFWITNTISENSMFLSAATFSTVIDATPLVSIDLILENPQGEILLGYRKNRPAQGFWFVPGGRIRKNESLADAFKRLTLTELGTAFPIEEARLQGPYDHFYSDSVFGESPSTHYVVIAYRLKIQGDLKLPEEQHSDYRWLTPHSLMKDSGVHANTKMYFL